MRFTKREAKKAGKATVILVLVYFILLTMGVAPFSTIGTSTPDEISLPLWARIECSEVTGGQNIVKESVEDKLEMWVPVPGASTAYIRTTEPIHCDLIGGCEIEAGVAKQQISGCLFEPVVGDLEVSVEYDDYFPKHTWVAAVSCVGYPSIASLDYNLEYQNPHKLYVEDPTGLVKGGYTDALQDTLNCELSQASYEFRQQLKLNPDGETITKFDKYGRNIGEETADIVYTDRQIVGDDSVNYVVGWDTFPGTPGTGNIVNYGGELLRCVPHEGVYEVNSVGSGSNKVYYQGLLKTTYGTGQDVCCGNNYNECGAGAECGAGFRCVPKGSNPGGAVCNELSVSEPICDWKNKVYYGTICVDGIWEEYDVEEPKCCPGLGLCDDNEFCDPLNGCVERVTAKPVAEGYCTINGELSDGTSVVAPTDSPYDTQYCPSNEKCCYSSESSLLGVCSESCELVQVQTSSLIDLGDMDLNFGYGDDFWNLVIIAIIIFFVLFLIIILMSR